MDDKEEILKKDIEEKRDYFGNLMEATERKENILDYLQDEKEIEEAEAELEKMYNQMKKAKIDLQEAMEKLNPKIKENEDKMILEE